MKNLDRLSKKNLGDILVDENLCSRAQVQEAHQLQAKTPNPSPLSEILLDINQDLTEGDIARAVSRQFQLPCMYAANYQVSGDAIDLVDRGLMHESLFIPVDAIGNTIVIIMGGLLSAEHVTDIESQTGKEVFLYVSTRSDVAAALKQHAPFDPDAKDLGEGGEDFNWEAMFDEANEELLADE